MRARPEGSPVMEQVWEDLLFLHWPVPEEAIRPLIPQHLEIDTFEGKAWIGITPFRLTGVRLMSLPAIPGFSAFNEINVRTYVLHDGKPGVWFFSLHASRILPAIGARVFFGLPYFSADMDFTKSDGNLRFQMKRDLAPETHFQAHWQQGARLRAPDTESLAFFLVERYALFSQAGGTLSMTRAYHHPWILDEGILVSLESTLIAAVGLPEPIGDPLVHFSSSPVTVQIWPPQMMR